MDEASWLTCDDGQIMLHDLHAAGTVISERKLRLFACACTRDQAVWQFLDTGVRAAVAVAEQFADGNTSDRARADAFALTTEAVSRPPHSASLAAIYLARAATLRKQILFSHLLDLDVFLPVQANWLREVLGNPFRALAVYVGQPEKRIATVGGEVGALVINQWPYKDFMTWQNGLVPKMASAIYDDCQWQDTPILADALVDAGCTAAFLIEHLRDPSHACGCWAIDLLTGRS